MSTGHTDDGIRVGPATDPGRYLATDQTVWFEEVPDAPIDDLLLSIPEQLRFAADVEGSDPATYPGIYGVRPMTLSVPGGEQPRRLPCAGLTWVGVHPDHRRRGILSAMLRHHFEQVRDESGTHLSALHASEPAIYGRHGYGLASLELTVRLGRGTTLHAPHLDTSGLRTELRTITESDQPLRFHASELRAGAGATGSIVGTEEFYTRICRQPAEAQRDKEPARMLFVTRDGADVGHALFRRKQKWEHGRPAGELTVHRLVGGPAERLVLLRRLVDFDLIGIVEVEGVAVDDALLHWVGGPRGAQDVQTYDSLWVRLVDLPEALQSRAYAAPCDVVVDVTDDTAPWNAGRWRIAVDGTGQAEVTRVDDEADVRLAVQALGAAYLGGSSLLAMLHAGLLEEQRRGAVGELSRSLRTDTAPVAAIGF